MIFPLGIDTSLDFVVITASLYTPKGDFQGFKRAMDAIREQVAASLNGFVILPMPNSLQDSTAHGWEIADGVTEEASNLANTYIEKATGGSGFLGAGADIAKKIAKKNGYNMDPKYWQMYNGSQPRTF